MARKVSLGAAALVVLAALAGAALFVYFWTRRKVDVTATVGIDDGGVLIGHAQPSDDGGVIYVD